MDQEGHPARFSSAKRRIIAIIVAIVAVLAVVLILLNIFVWQKSKTLDTTPLTDDELEAWTWDLVNAKDEASQLSDDDLNTFYANKINDETSEYKMIDLVIAYSRELSKRAFVDLSLDLLNGLNIDNMDCEQLISYYSAYAYAYYTMNNMHHTSESNYYQKLSDQAYNTCRGLEKGDYDYIDTETVGQDETE